MKFLKHSKDWSLIIKPADGCKSVSNASKIFEGKLKTGSRLLLSAPKAPAGQSNYNVYDDLVRNPPAPMVCRAPGLFSIFLVSVGLAAFQSGSTRAGSSPTATGCGAGPILQRATRPLRIATGKTNAERNIRFRRLSLRTRDRDVSRVIFHAKFWFCSGQFARCRYRRSKVRLCRGHAILFF